MGYVISLMKINQSKLPKTISLRFSNVIIKILYNVSNETHLKLYRYKYEGSYVPRFCIFQRNNQL